jgi:ribulose-5-phosphate 4-epimerase/fuculose-1-phosphate aldolase
MERNTSNDAEAALRDQVATLTRIFAMRGLLGVHGHISAFDPDTGRIYMCRGLGSDKATARPEDLFVFDLAGQVVAGEGRVPLEWPIHTAIHGARADALAVAHLHSPWATLFAVAQRPYQPVLIAARWFAAGLRVYPEPHLITTPERGERVRELLGDDLALLLRGHGVVVAANNLQELLYVAVTLEDNARAAVQAAALGAPDFLGEADFANVEPDTTMSIRARLVWDYFARQEARWDRQLPFGVGALG